MKQMLLIAAALLVPVGCSPPQPTKPTPVPSASTPPPAVSRTPSGPTLGPATPPPNPGLSDYPSISRFVHTDGEAKGLIVEVISAGTGEPVVTGTNVEMNYTGWYDVGQWTKGDIFDSSLKPGRTPFTVRNVGRGGVIDGWNLGIPTVGGCEGMRLGEKRRLLIPWRLAYGAAGGQGIPPRSNLIFEVELVAIR
jgi:hypothetical protein